MNKLKDPENSKLVTDHALEHEKYIGRICDSNRSFHNRTVSELPVKHTILIIDNLEQQSSDFYQFCSRYARKNAFKHPYYFCYLPLIEKFDSKNESILKRIICFEEKTERSEALLHLRAVILKINDEFHNYGRIIRYYYPNLPIFYVSSTDSDNSNNDFHSNLINNHLCFIVNHPNKRAAVEFILDRISQIIDQYFEAPYWDSLKRYADKPTINFHGLPIGRGRSISPCIRDFADFYGKNYLNAETSLSASPLDSLLLPHGPIKQAQHKAAVAFGAHVYTDDNECINIELRDELKTHTNDNIEPISQETGTRFVTNGTSTANHIIISAFVNPDDFVLLERNCHISHYNALATAHAKPLFLKPFINALGMAGPVPLHTINSTLSMLLEEKNSLPALIILTNPTFDGIFYKPRKVVAAIESVLSDYWNKYHNEKRLTMLVKTLAPYLPSSDFAISTAPVDTALLDKDAFICAAFRRMVFLFDEAWGSHAFFHPKLIEYSAMHAALILSQSKEQKFHNCIRFYSTQSTHKSLSALRQGSMIHYRDPLMAFPAFRHAFESSFRSHTTSSPNANIIASLDVARKQAQMDGLYLVERSIQLSNRFRHVYMDRLNNDRNHIFSVASYDQMLKSLDSESENLKAEDYALDPTKVTITWSLPIAGQTIKRLLLSNAIQINKYGCNSVLAIFNIGIDESSVETLKAALLALSLGLSDRGGNVENNQRNACRQQKKMALPDFSAVFNQHNLGYWLKNNGGFERTLIDVEKTYKEMQQQEKTKSDVFISAAFVTPYPPGSPVLIPGQVISAQDLNCLIDIPITEIMGVESIKGRMNIHVYLKGSDQKQASGL